jgi:hypothetical protein
MFIKIYAYKLVCSALWSGVTIVISFEWYHKMGVMSKRFIVIIDYVKTIHVNFFALDAQVSPVQNIIFLATHFFTLLVPIAQQPGHAVVLCRLSLRVWFPQSAGAQIVEQKFYQQNIIFNTN